MIISQFSSTGKAKRSLSPSNVSSKPTKSDMKVRDIYESLARTNLSMTLNTPFGNSNSFGGGEKQQQTENSIPNPSEAQPKSQNLLHKLPNSTLATESEKNACLASPIHHVAKKSPIRRQRKHISARNLPKITDQELQQLSGEYPLLY